MANVKGHFNKKCNYCSQVVQLPFYRLKRFKFCSSKCRNLSQVNKIPWNNGTKGLMVSNAGSLKKGHKPWNYGTAIKKKCIDCGKVSYWIREQERCHKCFMKFRMQIQENHPRWKGGISSEKHRLRGLKQWKEWRSAVFVRDKFICKECGASSVYLEPHHIIPIRSDKNKLFDITNGITLCRPCHQKTIWKEEKYQDKYLALTNSK